MLSDAEAMLYSVGAWPASVEGLSSPLDEVLFQRPEWLRIPYYRRDKYDRSRAEAIVQIRNKRGRFKSYWFPVTHRVMEKFLGLALYDSRGSALQYLREYVRKHRRYAGHWPDLSYSNDNSITPSMTPYSANYKAPGRADELGRY